MRAAVRIRRLTGMCAAVAALLAVPAGTAAAAPFTGSVVSTPGADARPMYDVNLGPAAPANRLAVRGTVSGGDGDGELRCYAATEGDPLHYDVVGPTPVATTAGRFEADVAANALPSACRLRFVPDGAPGPDANALGAFAGPRVLPLTRELFPSLSDPSVTARVRFTGAAAGAFATWEDVTHGGAPFTLPVVDPVTLRTGDSVFAGAATIAEPGPADPDPIALTVDGRASLAPGPAGVQVHALTVESDGSLTSATTEPLADAAPGGGAPGVALERRVTAAADGRTVTTADRWTSTDGRPHEVVVPYEHRFAPGAGFRLPWLGGGFAARSGPGPEILALPPGRVWTVEARRSATDPDPSLDNPLGAVTVSTRPDALRFTDPGALRVVFRRTVPATGALELVQRFATAPTADGLDRLVAANEEAARRSAPRVAFTSPTVASGFDPSYVLTGRVDVLGAVGALFVNGQPVTPAPDGTFIVPTILSPGANPATASVTDAAGDGASTDATITFTPPTASATYQRPTYRKGVISLPITCQALAGTGCVVRAKLTARFKRKVGRRARYKTVLLYGTTFRVPAQTSKTVTIRLSQRNRRLVRKYRRIRARLEVVQEGVTDAAGKPARRYWGVTLK